MKNEDLLSVLKMLGWNSFGGVVQPPFGKEKYYPNLFITGENELIIIGVTDKYFTCQEVLDYVMTQTEEYEL